MEKRTEVRNILRHNGLTDAQLLLVTIVNGTTGGHVYFYNYDSTYKYAGFDTITPQPA